jgi:hypothetical protein
VSNARFILVALICAAPAILLWDGLITQGLVAGVVAAGLTITARTLREGETEFLLPIIRPLAALAALPALWMVIQLLPVRAFAHPIWRSAESALGHSLTGAISVDVGATILAFGQYLSVVAVAFLSAAIAVNRERAEWLLFALTSAGTAIAILPLCYDVLSPDGRWSPFEQAQAIDCAALGAIAAIAACIRTVERNETAHLSSKKSIVSAPRHTLSIIIICGVAALLCLATLVFNGTRGALLGTACGIAALATVVFIRRTRLGAWGTPIIAAPAAAIALLIIATQPEGSLLSAYAASPTAISNRVLADAPLVGTGAGTFAAMAPIYREIDDTSSDSVVSTSAAGIAIELGRPMLWLIVAATALAILMLIRASLQRGRDSFYSAAAAGCFITLLLLAFINAGLSGLATDLLAAVVLGLGFAQSKSRSAQLKNR